MALRAAVFLLSVKTLRGLGAVNCTPAMARVKEPHNFDKKVGEINIEIAFLIFSNCGVGTIQLDKQWGAGLKLDELILVWSGRNLAQIRSSLQAVAKMAVVRDGDRL